MEVGAYLSFAVKNAFDKMAALPKSGEPGVMVGVPEATQKAVRKIISAKT